MSTEVDMKVRRLSGLRRSIYFAGLSRGLPPERAYAAAAARCCEPVDGNSHTAACAARWDES